MSESGVFTQLQRSEGKRKAAEDAANHYYRESVKLQQELDEARDALRELIPWARRALDGLEFEDEQERAELWEELCGPLDQPSVPMNAEAALNGSAPSRLEEKAYGGSM